MIHNLQQHSRFNRNYVVAATAAFSSVLPFVHRELPLSRFILMDAFDCCEFIMRVRVYERANVYIAPRTSTCR
jgi:hypothetical protein